VRRLLVDRRFGPYFWGNSVASAGVWSYNVGAVVLVFQITGSIVQVGLITVFQFTAPVVLAPVGGALADRVDRRKLMIIALSIAGSALAGLAAWMAVVGHNGLPNPLPVLFMSLVLGLTNAVTDPARHALVAALVPPVDLGQAVALNAVTFNLGRTLGPTLASLLLVWSGPTAVLAFAAFTYFVGVGSLVAVRALASTVDADRPHREARGFTAGIRYVWAHKRMLAILIGIAAAGYGSDPVLTLAPLLAAHVTRLGDSDLELVVGLLAGAYGAGALLSLPFLRRVTRRFGYHATGVCGLFALSVVVALLTVGPGLAVSMIALAVGGAGNFLANTSLTTMMQLIVPEYLRGRVMALWGVFFLGSRPVAALVDSHLSSIFSLQVALTVMVAVVAASAVIVLCGASDNRGWSRRQASDH
jgi:MFS family permease